MEEEIDIEKFKNEDFLSKEITILINDLYRDTQPKWGIMSAQHMLEHLEGSIKISNGEIQLTDLRVKEDEIPAKQEFLFSDKPFAKNIVIGKEAKLRDLKYLTFDEARAHFFKQLIAFFSHHDKNKNAKYIHPAFGELDYKGWLKFHVKHVKHHFDQFGILNE